MGIGRGGFICIWALEYMIDLLRGIKYLEGSVEETRGNCGYCSREAGRRRGGKWCSYNISVACLYPISSYIRHRGRCVYQQVRRYYVILPVTLNSYLTER
jgi:hypothetical protein